MAEALDAEWFLVANKDKLSIKIRGQVTLGEDDRGLLTLESRKEFERWLTLSIDQRGSLVVSELGDHWEVESPGAWVSQEPGVVCIPGTLLSLPNNEVYISHNLMRGKVQQHLLVQPHEGANDLDVVVPEVDVAPHTVAPVEPKQEEEVIDSTLDAPIEVKEPIRESEPEIPTLTTPVMTELIVKDKGNRTSKAALYGIFLLGAAGAGYYYWQSGQVVNSVASVPEQTAQPVEVPRIEESLPTVQVEKSVVDPVETSDVIGAESPQPDHKPEPIQSLTPLPEVVPEAVEQDWQQEIAEARFLMGRGFINYPERNAVSILGEILVASPGHPEAWQLLNQATEIYLVDAMQAHRDGFTDAAQEMVAEVERFHPNFDRLDQVKESLGLTTSAELN